MVAIAPSTTRRGVLALSAAALLGGQAQAADGPLVVAMGVNLAPGWLDPADLQGIVTPLALLYALHDAVVKPMPDNAASLCLAETHIPAADGLSHEFVLRAGARFHNGEAVTAEDVKFSFERYRGTAVTTLRRKIAVVETPDPRRVIFRLHKPWPDFITYYSRATGAGWVVPKKYIERAGEDGFRKAPVGAGPYRFVAFTPGVEMVLEAFEGYWRKPPKVQRLIIRAIPDATTRFAALKSGEVDVAYNLDGELAAELRRTPGLARQSVLSASASWIYFVEQFDPASPWHDHRVRLAASLALDRDAINQAVTLGFSQITGSIFPRNFEFYWQPPTIPYDPDRARALLAEAGLRGGFDAGDYYCDAADATLAEAVLINLAAVGIRATPRPMERASYVQAFLGKTLKNIIQVGPGAPGDVATRLERLVAKDAVIAFGRDPDIDTLHTRQEGELDPAQRQTMLHRIQQLLHERAICAPLYQVSALHGIGKRVAEPALGLIPAFPFSAPYEDIRLKTDA